jgi:hypothetical protein
MPLTTIIIIENEPDLHALVLDKIQLKNGISQRFNQVRDDYVWSNELIICDEQDLNTDIFITNKNLVQAIENMEVLMVIIGKSIHFKWTPINVQRVEKDDNIKNNVAKLIDKWLIIIDKINKREKVIANKLNRLFYILNEFETKEEIYMKEIIKATGVSKRTVQRDFQLIKEMLINKDIVFDENNGSYSLHDIIKNAR